MSNELYKRIYELKITTATQVINIQGLKIKYDITRDNSSEPNQGTIEIYNLSSVNRNLIKTGNADFPANVVLKIGYETFDAKNKIIGTLIEADAISVEEIYTKPDIILKISLGDGQKLLAEKRVNTSYKDGFSVNNVIKDLTSKLGAVVNADTSKQIDGFVTDSFIGGYVAQGTVKNVLDSIFGRFGKKYSIQNGELRIESEINNTKFLKLGFDSGLLEEPKKNDDGTLTFKALAMAGAVPEDTIKIISDEINSFYVIQSGKYQGGNYEDLSIMELTVK